MNESRLQRLLEDFQDDALNEAECRELMEWFDEDDSRVSAFVDELRVGNTLAALHVMESDRIPLAVKDSLQRGDLAIDISRNVRQRIESRPQPLPADVERSNLPLRKWAPWWIATAAVAAVIALCVFLPTQLDTNHGDVVATVQNARDAQEVSAGETLRLGAGSHAGRRASQNQLSVRRQTGASGSSGIEAAWTKFGAASARRGDGAGSW